MLRDRLLSWTRQLLVHLGFCVRTLGSQVRELNWVEKLDPNEHFWNISLVFLSSKSPGLGFLYHIKKATVRIKNKARKPSKSQTKHLKIIVAWSRRNPPAQLYFNYTKYRGLWQLKIPSALAPLPSANSTEWPGTGTKLKNPHWVSKDGQGVVTPFVMKLFGKDHHEHFGPKLQLGNWGLWKRGSIWIP